MQVTKKEVYESSKNLTELISKADAGAEKQITDAPVNLPTQEIVDKNQIKGAIDFANGKKFDGQLEAALLKNRLNDTAARLDQFQEGDLKGFEKEAKKAKVEDLGVIKDNLGKDIVKKEGPGIDDMYKKGKNYEMPDRDPLKDMPKTVKQEKDAKKAPDMPLKDDAKLVSWKPCEATDTCVGDNKVPVKSMSDGEKMSKMWEILKDAGVLKAGEDAKNKAKGDGGTKYVDPDQVDATKVEKPKEPPPDSKSLIGHQVNPLHHDPIIDKENIDVKTVVEEHKKVPEKTLIYTDPDQTHEEAKFDPSNPPQLPGDELKNTGNPIDAEPAYQNAPMKEPEGDQPHTDGERDNGGTKIPVEKDGGTPPPFGGDED